MKQPAHLQALSSTTEKHANGRKRVGGGEGNDWKWSRFQESNYNPKQPRRVGRSEGMDGYITANHRVRRTRKAEEGEEVEL